MARIRTIKPEFCTSSQLAECSTSARLLFVLMWMHCDDAGRHVADFVRLKMECFPGDPFTKSEIESMVGELIDNGLLVEYKVKSSTQVIRYWQVTGWHHQKIDRPTVKHPGPEEGEIVARFDDASTTPRRALDESSPPEGKGRESTVPIKELASASSLSSSHSRTSTADVDRVVSHFQTYHPKSRPGPKERKLIASRLKDGYSVEDLTDAIDGMHLSPHNCGKNDRNTTYQTLELAMRNGSKVDQYMAAKNTAEARETIPF